MESTTPLRRPWTISQDWIACVLSAAIMLVICMHWWHPGAMLGAGDGGLQPNFGVALSKGYTAWSRFSTFTGRVDNYFVALPYVVLAAVLQNVLGAGLGQVAVIAVLLFSGWFGVYALGRTVGLRPLYACFAAWAYGFNLFTQVTVVGGLNVTAMWFMALFPWCAYLFTRALKQQTWRSSALFYLAAISLFGLPVLGLAPQIFVQFAVDCALWCAVVLATQVPRDAWLGAMRWLALVAGAMLLFSAWWSIPDALSFMGTVIGHPITSGGNAWAFARSSLLNLLRFNAQWSWGFGAYVPYAASFDANPIAYASGFLIAMTPVLALAFKHQAWKFTRLLLVVSLVALFISKNVHSPLAFVNVAFFHLPLAFVYQDPSGATFFALLAMALVGGYGVQSAAPWFTGGRKPLARAGTVALLFAVICAGAWQMVSGTLFRTEPGDLPSLYVRIPSYWYDLAAYLNAKPNNGGVLALPSDAGSYQVGFDFGYYGIDVFPDQLVFRPTLYLRQNDTGYSIQQTSADIDNTVSRLLHTRSTLLLSVLRELGIRYVVYRSSIYTANETLTEREQRRLFGAPRARFGPTAVYDLGSVPEDFRYERAWIASNYVSAQAGRLLELGALEEASPRISANSLTESTLPPVVYEHQANIDAQALANVSVPDIATRSVWLTDEDRAQLITNAPHPVLRASLASQQAAWLLHYSAALAAPDKTQYPGEAAWLFGEALNTQSSTANPSATIQIFNPAAVPYSADIRVAMRSQFPMSFALSNLSSAARADVKQAGTSPVWADFHGLTVKPGINRYELRSLGPLHGSARSDLAVGERLFSVSFRHVHAATDKDSSGHTVGEADATVEPLVSMDLNLPVAVEPVLGLHTTETQNLPELISTVHVTGSGRHRACQFRLPWNALVSLKTTVVSCLRSNDGINVPTHIARVEIGVIRGADSDPRQMAIVRGAEIELQTAQRAPENSLPISLDSGDGRLVRTGDNSALLSYGDAASVPLSGDVVDLWYHNQHLHGTVLAAYTSAMDLQDQDGAVHGINLAQAGPVTVLQHRIGVEGRGDLPGASSAVFRIKTDADLLSPPVVELISGSSRRYVRLFDEGTRTWGAQVPLPGRPAYERYLLHFNALVAPGERPLVNAEVAERPTQSAFADPAFSGRILATSGTHPTRSALHAISAMASVAAYGPAPMSIAHSSLSTAAYALNVYRVRTPAGAGVTVFNQLYHPLWVAVNLRGLRVLPHVRADGWRNAWFTRGSEDLLVLNVLVLYQAVAFGAALLALSVMIWKRLQLRQA